MQDNERLLSEAKAEAEAKAKAEANAEAQSEAGASAQGAAEAGRERADEAPVASPPSIGAELRRARDALHLTLEELAGELRIARRLLEALEQDQFEALGPPVFAKGYLKQYGRRLGLDADVLVSRYQQRGEDKDIFISPTRRPIRLRDDGQIGLWVGAIVALALLAAAIALWWWSGSPLPTAESFATPETSSPAELGIRPQAPVPNGGATAEAQSVQAGLEGVANAGEAQAAPAGAAPPRGPAIAESSDASAAAAQTGAQPTSDERERNVEDLSRDRPQAANAPVAPPNGPRVSVHLRFSDDCWVEVNEVDGRRLYYGLARAGRELELSGVGTLRFFFGNADAAALEIDGRPYPVPAEARRGRLANFIVAPPEH